MVDVVTGVATVKIKTGHKDEASFKVRMSGSDQNCLPNVQKWILRGAENHRFVKFFEF